MAFLRLYLFFSIIERNFGGIEMKEVIKSMFEFIYTLSMGDYFFFIGTFLLIVLFIYVLYLIKLSEIEYKEGENIINEDGFDIESTIERIEKEYKNN